MVNKFGLHTWDLSKIELDQLSYHTRDKNLRYWCQKNFSFNALIQILGITLLNTFFNDVDYKQSPADIKTAWKVENFIKKKLCSRVNNLFFFKQIFYMRYLKFTDFPLQYYLDSVISLRLWSNF